jgi:hypothetical protein
VLAEQIGQFDGLAVFVDEIIVRRCAAGRQGAALFGDAFDVAPQFDLFCQQGGAGPAVFGAVVGIGMAVFAASSAAGVSVVMASSHRG